MKQRFRTNNMSIKVDQRYQSFLVRCWFVPPETSDEPPNWRFELREVSAESLKHGFGDLEQLKSFISERLVAIGLEDLVQT